MKNRLFIIFTLLISFMGTIVYANGSREPYKKNKSLNLYRNRHCLRIEKKEKYIPGTYFYPGYVKHWKEHTEVECTHKSAISNCFILEYDEEYIPGRKDKIGYVRTWYKKISVPCDSKNKDSVPKNIIRRSRRF